MLIDLLRFRPYLRKGDSEILSSRRFKKSDIQEGKALSEALFLTHAQSLGLPRTPRDEALDSLQMLNPGTGDLAKIPG